MKRSLLILLIASLSSLQLSASANRDSLARIQGIVYGESDNITLKGQKLPLPGCVVQLFFERSGKLDSLFTTASAPSGQFSFKAIPAQRVILRLQHFNYDTKTEGYKLSPGDNAFLLTMKLKKRELKEATVTADIPLMKQLRDTTIFNTAAVRTMTGDGLRKVLEQIPGFKVTEKEIYVDGVKVSKTYVNGITIFGDDAMNAVNALKADEVTQVKVFEEQSALDKRRGLKHSRKQKVLDVVTKDKFMSLSQLGIAASGGADGTGQGRYSGAGAIQYDSEMMNLNVTVNGSNLNDEISTLTDISKMSDFKSRKPMMEYCENERVGLNFAKYWKDRQFGNSFAANYDYNHKYIRSASKALTDYFETASNPAMQQMDSTFSSSSVGRHIFSSSLSLLDTPLKSFIFGLNGSYTDGRRRSLDISTRQTGNSLAFGRHDAFSSKNKDWDISGHISWTNNNAVKWRPEANVNVNYRQNSTLSWTVDTLATSFMKRQLSSDGYGRGIAADGKAGVSAYLLNDTRHTFALNLFAKAEYNHSRGKQMAVDEWDVTVPVPDLANSYDYTRHDMTVSAVGGFNYSTSQQLNVTGELSLNEKLLLDDEFYPVGFSNRKNFLYPEYNLSVRIPKWSFSSSMKASSPSIEQISNRICDTNPMILTGGNPDLNQAFNLSANIAFNPKMKATAKSNHSGSFNIKASCIFRPIAGRMMFFDSDTVLDQWDGYEAQAGSVLNTFSNASRPSWETEFSGYYNGMMLLRKLIVRVQASLNYSQKSQFNGEDEIWIGDWMARISGSVGYNFSRKLRIVTIPSISYINSVHNTGKGLSSRLIYGNSLSAHWNIIPRLRLQASYDIAGFKYLSGFGKNNLRQTLNAMLTLNLLKDSSLKISLQAFDLLNSGSMYQSSINASYMMQRWQASYGRYFLLNINYVFRNKK